ncbi:citrulline utilization hydrolase CtlX [Phocaeicola sp.]
MTKQTTNHILMIEPVAFGFNEETAANNYFQQRPDAVAGQVQNRALTEFRGMVEKLRSHGIDVLVIRDTPVPHTPDSIFPNNWVSFHADGTIALYPMFAENRRPERRDDILQAIAQEGFAIYNKVDYTAAETANRFLEGTGSIILDRVNRYAYAALSQRTDKELFLRFCKDFGYKPLAFHANQTVEGKRLPIYHTNVMMCVATDYAVICLDAIDDAEERAMVCEALTGTGKEVVEITEEQLHCFAGNLLQVENDKGELFLVMSQSAYDSLNKNQLERLASYNVILPVAIHTIETLGGGSARCMMAELF